MATRARYMSIVGGNRIVFLRNKLGAVGYTDVLKNLEAELYAAAPLPGEDQSGNRKIAIKMKIQPVFPPVNGGDAGLAEDRDFRLRVKVPAGVIAAPGIQRFTQLTPMLSYYPRAWADAQNETCIPECVSATPLIEPWVSPDPINQTVDIWIHQLGLDDGSFWREDDWADELIFLVTVDWSHTIVN